MSPSLTFHDHIKELRHRLLWVLLVVGFGSILGYVFRGPIILVLQRPLGAPLFYNSPAGSFNFILKVSGLLGLMMALPLIVYNSIRFVEPALPNVLKRFLLLKVIIFSTILAALGVAFGFFIIIPMSLHFFSRYSSAAIQPLISADAYLSFVSNTLLTFALLFQIPLIVLFINRIKPIKPSKLLRYQRHVVVSAFVLAVILPFTYDPITQFVMAIPIVFLYYLSIILVWMVNRRVEYPAEAVGEVAEPNSELQLPTALPEIAEPKPRLRRQHPANVLNTTLDGVKLARKDRPATQFKAPPAMQVNRYNILDLSQES